MRISTAVVTLSACGSNAGVAGAVASDDAGVPATFTEIYAEFFPATTNARCNFCHSMPSSNSSNGMLSVGMDRESAYQALVGPISTSKKCAGKALVVPNDPDRSLFFQKLASTPPCGGRMPVGGMKLSEGQLQMVRSWIEDGARNN